MEFGRSQLILYDGKLSNNQKEETILIAVHLKNRNLIMFLETITLHEVDNGRKTNPLKGPRS